jgi:putative phosphoesterase
VNLNIQERIKVGIVSDTHGFIDPRIIDVVAKCDIAVHAGDIGNANSLVSLETRLGYITAVRGNNDVAGYWPVNDRVYLQNIPEIRHLDLPGGRLSVEHGYAALQQSDPHEVLRQKYPDSRVIVYGHSHQRIIDTGATPWVINPGASGRSRTYGGPSCLVLATSEEAWEVSEYSFNPL